MAAVQSIERAFQLLGTIADGPATISDLARRVELPNSTVARILKTLQNLAVVHRLDDGTFTLGATALRLGANLHASADVMALDHARLTALTAQLGEITGLSVRDGRSVHYIAQVDSPQEVQVRDWTGERIPLHVASSGLVLLANTTKAAIEEYLSGDLQRFTGFSQSKPDQIRLRLNEVRRNGVVWTKEEYHHGINSVAAPIFNAKQEVAAALHCHGPAYRFPSPGDDDRVAANVRRVAASLSHSIGWTGHKPGPNAALA